MKTIARFLTNDEAATTVEYCIMLALIVMAVFASIGLLGSSTNGIFNLFMVRAQEAGM
jgi:Flp pilus assembly pilin Flp